MADHRRNKPTKNVQQWEDEFEEEEEEEEGEDQEQEIQEKVFNSTALIAPKDYFNFMKKKKMGANLRNTKKTKMTYLELPTILMAPADYINYTPGFPKPKAKRENFIPDDAPTVLLEDLKYRRSPKKQSPHRAAPKTPLRNLKTKIVRREIISEDLPFSSEDETMITGKKKKRRKKGFCCCC